MTNNMDTYGVIICGQIYISKWFLKTLFYLKRLIRADK
jgi:hypothetical protein